MGGYGSGRSPDSKKTTGRQLMIDIRWMKKQRLLVAGKAGVMAWECREKETGCVGYHVEKDRLILKYQNKTKVGEWESIEDEVFFTSTPCYYGGRRQWLLCPGCNRRVALLYGGKYFRCRFCHNLTYSSQQEGRADRLLRRARKIRRRMGGKNNLMEPFPRKPKNMHWKTYSRLRKEAEEAVALSWWIMGSSFR